MAKQKIVIKVQMGSDKCRSRAMALVAATGGVDSVAIAGDGKDQVVVVGDGVDSIRLTEALRRKVGNAELLQVGDAKKEEDKKPAAPAAVVEVPAAWYYSGAYHYHNPPPPPLHVYDGYYARPADTCSIM